MRVFLFLFASLVSNLAAAQSFPDLKPLDWPEKDLSDRMMNGAHRFIDHSIASAKTLRSKSWTRVEGDREEWVLGKRNKLRAMLGMVETVAGPRIERFGDDMNPVVVFKCAKFTVFQARWPTVGKVYAVGLYVKQNGQSAGSIVLIPDASQTPEALLGMEKEGGDSAPGLELANRGFDLLIPTLVSRDEFDITKRRVRQTKLTNREWIYRQAFHMGRHIIGFEVESVLAGVSAFEKLDTREKIGVMGYGEGGMIALLAGALDPRIEVTVVSGYFGDRQQSWNEPISRNLFGRLNEFGDAEVASLVYPRRLIIEHSKQPDFSNSKGKIATGDIKSTYDEVLRINSTLDRTKPGEEAKKWSVRFVHKGDDPGQATVDVYSDKTLEYLLAEFKGVHVDRDTVIQISDRRTSFSTESRQNRLVEVMESHVQELVRASEHVRDKRFLYSVMPELENRRWSTDKELPTSDLKKFVNRVDAYRSEFHEKLLGKFEGDLLPPNARVRKLKETDKWVAYDVVLDVYQDLFAWGVILVPRGIQKGEKRPVVVCQHGRNGLPRDTIDGNKTAYNNFAAKLADEGFVTFSPHNLYRGEDRYRWLDRKANSVGKTLFSFIVAQHDQITRWLSKQPFVDGDRIAFYGLSYGGETAVRVPTVLKRYCLSICSGDFNQWTRKVAATDQKFSFMGTIEWEMPYWNLGHTYDYAEMAYLMVPRPFMVERGHLDLVGKDQWVAHEYAKVRWLYAQLGIGDKTEIEFFQGGHSINGERTFEFLRKHLRRPK